MSTLVSLADYKIAKGISSTNEDAKLTPLLDSVSEFIRTYCGRSFTSYYDTPKVEYFSVFWGETFLFLEEGPVVEIISVEERGTFTDAYEPIESYYLDRYTDAVYKIAPSGISNESFKTGNGSVKITYKAGFATCPLDLKLAVIDLVTYYLKEEYKPNRSIGSTSMQNASQSSIPNSAELPAHIKRVLDLYRVI